MITTTKSPTILRTIALAAAVAVSLAACGGSDSSDAGSNAETTVAAGSETTAVETTVPETTAPAEPVTADQLGVESGFASGVTGIGVRATSVAAVVTNNASSTACSVRVSFSLKDASGAELDSQTAKVASIAAGAAIAVVPNALNTGDAQPASLDATVLTVGECDPATTASSLTVSASTLDADLKYIRGSVTNDGDAAAEGATVSCVLRDSSKAIVGGAKASLRDALEPAASADFKVRLVWAPDTAASADCTAA